MNTPRSILVQKKKELEETLKKALVEFEEDTGLCVTEIRLPRPEVAGGAEPKLDRVEAVIQLIG